MTEPQKYLNIGNNNKLVLFPLQRSCISNVRNYFSFPLPLSELCSLRGNRKGDHLIREIKCLIKELGQHKYTITLVHFIFNNVPPKGSQKYLSLKHGKNYVYHIKHISHKSQ